MRFLRNILFHVPTMRRMFTENIDRRHLSVIARVALLPFQKNEARPGPGEGPRALQQADTYKEHRKSAG